MIDIRLVRGDPDAVRAALSRRLVDPAEVDRLLEADVRARNAVGVRDEIRARVKELSRQVSQARRSGDEDDAARLVEESRRLGDEERQADSEATAAQTEVRELLLWLPNLPSPDAPDGSGPRDNPIVRRWPSEPRSYAEHQRVPHWDVGAQLGILDLDRAAKLSGSMFPLYRG
ncbi:MAG TPA: serine--tRNA ligase, partial [Acidimicrobiales bacterium]|nr:serine--tRNA ligase [Acidimicrobiales bacterium]